LQHNESYVVCFCGGGGLVVVSKKLQDWLVGWNEEDSVTNVVGNKQRFWLQNRFQQSIHQSIFNRDSFFGCVEFEFRKKDILDFSIHASRNKGVLSTTYTGYLEMFAPFSYTTLELH
jgi:hypothetical protein